MFISVHIYAAGRQRLTSGFFTSYQPFFMKQGLCLAWPLMTKLGWVACKHILCFQSSEIKAHATTSGVLHGFWCWRAGRHACKHFTKLALSPASVCHSAAGSGTTLEASAGTGFSNEVRPHPVPVSSPGPAYSPCLLGPSAYRDP